MTAKDPRPSRVPHRTWWKAPLIVSVPGVPLLALEYAMVLAQAGMEQYGGMLHTALALFAVAWALPHRRSMRTPRVLAACAALAITVFPVGLLVLLAVMFSA
ncbi:hypothetical protein [Streptomyces sp. NPDC003401]